LGALPLFASAAAAAEPDTTTPEPDKVTSALAEIDPDRLTPREALEALYRLKALTTVPDAAPSGYDR
jgi:DNA mismatch repair protein MutS